MTARLQLLQAKLLHNVTAQCSDGGCSSSSRRSLRASAH
jgi:hypothetical protein